MRKRDVVFKCRSKPPPPTRLRCRSELLAVVSVNQSKNSDHMEKAREFLPLSKEQSESVSQLAIQPHRVGLDPSFYEDFALRGIRVDWVEPGFVSCTFKVPPRLTDRNGNLATGAIANLVDEVGGAVVHVEGLPMNLSVDMSISFLSSAKLNVINKSTFICNVLITPLLDLLWFPIVLLKLSRFCICVYLVDVGEFYQYLDNFLSPSSKLFDDEKSFLSKSRDC
uniref:Uncharacterized protein MANES_17G018900 n=1 Tax=Rhizophora mucronata TaxID=61149 RepID=A0A2P2JUN7_RHIMU